MPFYPRSFERGQCSCRAVAKMYFGVSTRTVQGIMEIFGIEIQSPYRVSLITKDIDGQLET